MMRKPPFIGLQDHLQDYADTTAGIQDALRATAKLNAKQGMIPNPPLLQQASIASAATAKRKHSTSSLSYNINPHQPKVPKIIPDGNQKRRHYGMK